MQYLVSKLPDINKEIKDNEFYNNNFNFVSKDNQINLLNLKIQDQGLIIKKLIKKIKILELEKNNDNERNNNKDFFEFATCCSIFKSPLYNEDKKNENHQNYNKLFNLNCINKSFMENGFLAESDLNVKSNLKRCNSAKLIENRKLIKLNNHNNQNYENLSQIKNNNINSALNMSLISNDSIKIVKMTIKDKLKQYKSNLKSNEINLIDHIGNNTHNHNNQKTFHYNIISTNKKISNKMINSDTRKTLPTKYNSNDIIKTIIISNDSIHKNKNLNKLGINANDNKVKKVISKKFLKYTNSIIDKNKKKNIITNITESKEVNKIIFKGGKNDDNKNNNDYNHNQIVKLHNKNNSSALIKTNKGVNNIFKNKNDSNEVGQLIPINKDLIRGKKSIEKDKLSRNMSSLNCGKEFIIGEVLQKSFRTKDTNDDYMY